MVKKEIRPFYLKFSDWFQALARFQGCVFKNEEFTSFI